MHMTDSCEKGATLVYNIRMQCLGFACACARVYAIVKCIYPSRWLFRCTISNYAPKYFAFALIICRWLCLAQSNATDFRDGFQFQWSAHKNLPQSILWTGYIFSCWWNRLLVYFIKCDSLENSKTIAALEHFLWQRFKCSKFQIVIEICENYLRIWKNDDKTGHHHLFIWWFIPLVDVIFLGVEAYAIEILLISPKKIWYFKHFSSKITYSNVAHLGIAYQRNSLSCYTKPISNIWSKNSRA